VIFTVKSRGRTLFSVKRRVIAASWGIFVGFRRSAAICFQKMTPSDLELLQRFARDRAQDAFTELVRRHLNLVYSAALRQVRSPQLAEEIAQSVFADLARDARKISGTGVSPVSSLTPWLFAVTRRTAVDVIRKESRRQLREQLAYEMNITNAPDASWQHIEPLLDEAVAELDEPDRAAVLLRFFENQSLRDVGQQLGVSDDAAQKRVSRAVERLREFFAKRGISVGAGGLVVVISANAVQAAPVGLAVTISAAAFAGTAVTTSTIIAATTKTIAMTTLQKTLVTATVAVLAGAGIYQAKQAHDARVEAQTLQQQQAPLADEIQKLQNNFADATNRLADLLAENLRLKLGSNQAELLKLRGQVGVLQAKASQQTKPKREPSIAEIAKSPQMQEMMKTMKSSAAASLDKVYAKFFADLKLTPEQVSTLKQLISDKMTAGLADRGASLVGKLSSDQIRQLNDQINAEKAGVDDQIRQTLGADGFAAYQAYEKTYTERSQIVGPMGFADQLTGSMELTSDQTENLVQAMADERQRFKFSVDYSDPGKLAGDVATMYSDENISQYQKEMEQLNQLYLARAQTILTPDQQTVFQKHLSNLLAGQNMMLKMTANILAARSGKN
jgi:RNA polymerase sigma factor (sigma-70 family)